MSDLPGILSGFIHMVWQELKFLVIHKSRASYLIFIIIFGISLYGVGIQDYGAQLPTGMEMPGGMKTGDSILTDILIFMFILGMTAFESASQGMTPEIVFPAELGITFIMLVSILVGVNMISRLAIRCAASSISREREARTLYIIGSTANSRMSLYLAKLSGALLTTVPMILIMMLGVFWISVSVFQTPGMSGFMPELTELMKNIVIMTISTTLLFTSLGTLISVRKKDEESAVSLSAKFTTIAATLAMLWILLPVFSVAGNKILSMVQTVVMISPITQDLMVLYGGNNALVIQYALIQLLAALVLIILGIIVFIRQDIEY